MKQVYFFGSGHAEGQALHRSELGGKGANLAEMSQLGLPIPPGFTIATSVCMQFLQNGFVLPKEVVKEILLALTETEKAMQCQFGDESNPLLVSVRSGARVSMPGMMDSVLNIGINSVNINGLIKKTNNPRFAYDCYRRFIQMYAQVVKGLEAHHMEDVLDNYKRQKNIEDDSLLSTEDLKKIIDKFKKIYQNELKETFPEDPFEQLWQTIGAVFVSWNCTRAKKYREIHKIPENWGTAVNVCAMVYGNMGATSGTGVCFTRDPSTGENHFYGEYLVNAQGEDVVSGIRTPKPLQHLEIEMPEVYLQLRSVREKLEKHYKDVQDIEFTIQEGILYILQARNAKRSTQAALKIAIDFVHEGVISKKEAIMMVKPKDLDKILHPTINPRAHKQVIAKGLPASPGAVTGRAVFSSLEAEAWVVRGESVILVREETSPEDIGGIYAAHGLLTARGGMTSHAAVVARQMGKCCVAGCSSLKVSQILKSFKISDVEVLEGDWLTLDGSTGEVMLGKVETQSAELSKDFQLFMQWAKEIRTLKVKANADTPRDAEYARSFGAEGIGLCRTEHMFFAENRIPYVRQMILAKNKTERKTALNSLITFQIQDFVEILSSMEGYEVTIRLLDPPLQEFLPHTDKEFLLLSGQIGLSVEEIRFRVKSLHESNPLLGHRGCRLGISHPEIYEIQVQAIVEATKICQEKGMLVYPEIMIPFVSFENELKWLKDRLKKIAPHLSFGTMIEVPRAALIANKIAKHADFFSFGTNDLTQTTFGLSCDDSASFLKTYKQEYILEEDPFVVLDKDGVGALIRMACKLGKEENSALRFGVCGEHAGDAQSVEFFHRIGLSYLSCSPFKIPLAMLAAAQASVKNY